MAPSPTRDAPDATSLPNVLNMRPRKRPIDLDKLTPEEREKKERKLAENRNRVSESRAKKKRLKEAGLLEEDPEKLARRREYQKILMRERRKQARGAGSSQPASKRSRTTQLDNQPELLVMNVHPGPSTFPRPEISFPNANQDVPATPSPFTMLPPEITARNVRNDTPPAPWSSPLTRTTPPSLDLQLPIPTPSLHPNASLLDYTSFPGCVYPLEAKDVIWPGGGIKTKLLSPPCSSSTPHHSSTSNISLVSGLFRTKMNIRYLIHDISTPNDSFFEHPSQSYIG